jgi:hypothetical protein
MRALPSARSVALVLTAVSALAIALGCTPKAHERRPHGEARGHGAHDDEDGTGGAAGDEADMHKGVAASDEWLGVEGFGARVRVPKGWEFGQQGVLVLGTEPRSKAAFILVGAAGAPDARKKYEIGLELLKLDVGESSFVKRTVTIHGIAFERQDYEKASVGGKRARGVALAGDAPKGRGGLLLFLGYSLEGEAALEKELGEAVESISRE